MLGRNQIRTTGATGTKEPEGLTGYRIDVKRELTKFYGYPQQRASQLVSDHHEELLRGYNFSSDPFTCARNIVRTMDPETV